MCPPITGQDSSISESTSQSRVSTLRGGSRRAISFRRPTRGKTVATDNPATSCRSLVNRRAVTSKRVYTTARHTRGLTCPPPRGGGGLTIPSPPHPFLSLVTGAWMSVFPDTSHGRHLRRDRRWKFAVIQLKPPSWRAQFRELTLQPTFLAQERESRRFTLVLSTPRSPPAPSPPPPPGTRLNTSLQRKANPESRAATCFSPQRRISSLAREIKRAGKSSSLCTAGREASASDKS